MKKCGSCKQLLSLSEFNANKARKDGLQGECRTCTKEYYKKYYESRRPQEIARLRVSNKRRQKSIAEFVNLQKNKPCMDCGISYPSYVMDFDHLGNKIASIAVMVQEMRSIAKIQAEINKCDLVCANCHRERTHGRLIGLV